MKRSAIREDRATDFPYSASPFDFAQDRLPAGYVSAIPTFSHKKAGGFASPGFFSFQNQSLFQNRHQAFKHLTDDVRRGAFDEAGLAGGPIQRLDLMGVDAAVGL